MRPISFSSDGYVLAGNFFAASKPGKLAFLFIQGWTGHQNLEAAQALATLGCTSMTYDMRGNRDSEGDIAAFSRADFVRDAVVAYDFLKKQLGDDTPIGVVGSSLGSYTGVLLSKERPVACLSLRVPASYPDEGFTDPQLPQARTPQLAAWRQKPLHYGQNSAFQALHDFKGSIQIIEAGDDELVCHQAVQNYADSVNDPSKLRHDVMPEAPHSLVNEQLQERYVTLLTAWVKKQL